MADARGARPGAVLAGPRAGARGQRRRRRLRDRAPGGGSAAHRGAGERVLPHELRNPGSHEEELTEEQRKWNPGSSGAFGSGGGGHH
ncbi:DUF6479 family protein [Streptomyces sp. CA-181903]|uniref:DUF6479 family protein n=1 Tax=Streptomyces sp. CA-181903 TaxID=3240055 RepID=UPI003D94071E